MYESVYGGFQLYFSCETTFGTGVNAPTKKRAMEILQHVATESIKVPPQVLATLQQEMDLGVPDPTWDGVYPTYPEA